MHPFTIPLSTAFVSVSQNPFADETLLQFSVFLLPAKLKIIDTRNPNKVFEKAATSVNLPFGKDLPPGTYIMTIESYAVDVQVLRLEKERITNK